MRLTDLVDRDHAFKYVIGFVLAVIFLVVVATPSLSLSGFYLTLDELSDSVRRNDFDQAEEKLAETTAFYEGSRAWGLQALADSYLFRDAFLHQASYNYLTGDYEAVVSDLADDIDDPRASYLLASAKFQLARIRYRAIPADADDAEAMRQAIIQEVLDDVNADYERALRADSDGPFEYKWNYDLTSDAEATRRALEAPQELEPPELEQMKGEGTPVRRRRG